MPDTRTYYVISDDNCKFESMTKEQILAAITQAVESHEIADVNTGFVTTIKEQNKNKPLAFWVGTTAEYNALQSKPENTFCILTDENDITELESEISDLVRQLASESERIDANESAISDLENTDAGLISQIQRLNDDVDEIQTKNGQVLLDQEVAYGGGLSIPLQGTYQLTEFKVVMVTAGGVNILCSVQKETTSGGITLLSHIVGTGARFTPVNNPAVINVDLTVNNVTNTLENNQCLQVTFALSSNTFSQSEVSITKIVGIA